MIINIRAGGRLVYKCRTCGDTDRSMGVPDVLRALMHIQIDGSTASIKEWGTIVARATDTHTCNSYTIGVSDLIGGEYDK